MKGWVVGLLGVVVNSPQQYMVVVIRQGEGLLEVGQMEAGLGLGVEVQMSLPPQPLRVVGFLVVQWWAVMVVVEENLVVQQRAVMVLAVDLTVVVEENLVAEV